MAKMKKQSSEEDRIPKPGVYHEMTPERVNEFKKCMNDIFYFAEHYYYIIDPEKGKTKIKLHACQKQAIKKMMNNRFTILLASRQVGKSTMMALVALWHAIFKENYSVLLLANKESTAQEIFNRVRMAYEMLPAWLKSGAVEYAKTFMKLENESRIIISTTTSDSGRGMAINMLLLDEFAFVENDKEFYTSVFPIISASHSSKVVISSTPNGTDNKYYELVSKAEEGSGVYVLHKIHWSEVPGRGAKWVKETKEGIDSEEAWLQEYELVFLNRGDSSLSEQVFQKLEKATTQPIQTLMGGAYRIWKTPDDSRHYVVGVDIAEGVGDNATCVKILDITDLGMIEEVGEYWDNTISPAMFTSKLFEILKHWGCPPVLIERNNCGAQVVDQLFIQHEYQYIVDWGMQRSATARNKHYNRMGVVSHTNVKYTAVVNMRYFVNDTMSVKINSRETVLELRNFVRGPNGQWGAKVGKLDDRVMSLVWALNILDPLCTQEWFTIQEYDSYGKPKAITPAYEAYGVKTRVQKLDDTETFTENGQEILHDSFIIGKPKVFSDIDKFKQQGFTVYSDRFN